MSSTAQSGGARMLLAALIEKVGALATLVQNQPAPTMPQEMTDALSSLAAAMAALVQQQGHGNDSQVSAVAQLGQLHADLIALAGYQDGVEGKLDALASLASDQKALASAANTLLAAVRDALVRPTPWSAIADSGALLIGTTSKLLKASAGALLRNYVSALQLSNTNTLTAARVEILDGTMLLWAGVVPPNTTVGLPVALASSVATALNARLSAALTGGVLVNAQGYVA